MHILDTEIVGGHVGVECRALSVGGHHLLPDFQGSLSPLRRHRREGHAPPDAQVARSEIASYSNVRIFDRRDNR